MKTYTLKLTQTDLDVIRVALANHSEAFVNRANAYKAIGDTNARIAALVVATNATSANIKVLGATL
ncbi:MAG: hypothetical protein EBR81_11730 [Proteobacteria bacterium]|nr:hypothetical protein [Pseudomonadota bacterium]